MCRPWIVPPQPTGSPCGAFFLAEGLSGCAALRIVGGELVWEGASIPSPRPRILPMRSPLALRFLLGALLVAILAGEIATAAEEAPKPASGTPASDKPAPRKPAPAAVAAPGSDTTLIYKFDPLAKKYTAVARKDLKPQHVYQRFSPGLGTWVWSKAAADGALRYAFGPGSSQPAALFDMPVNSEERTKAFEKQAPELAKRLAINGAKPSLRLGDDGQWSLMPDSTKGRVYDLESGQRFEWHGGNVVPVTHGAGSNLWTRAGGQYLPVGEKRYSAPPSYQW